jgi:hypothetical protein
MKFTAILTTQDIEDGTQVLWLEGESFEAGMRAFLAAPDNDVSLEDLSEVRTLEGWHHLGRLHLGGR